MNRMVRSDAEPFNRLVLNQKKTNRHNKNTELGRRQAKGHQNLCNDDDDDDDDEKTCPARGCVIAVRSESINIGAGEQ